MSKTGFVLKCWQARFLLFSIVLSLMAPVIVNEKPLLIFDRDGGVHFPVFKSATVDTSGFGDGFSLHALIPYSPGKSDYANAGFKGPFDQHFELDENGKLTPLPWYKHHWFGTDLRGSDILAYTVYGLRNSIGISLIAILISLVIASLIGFIGGWYVRDPLRVGVLEFLVIVFWMFLIFHGVLNIYSQGDKWLYLAIVTLICYCALQLTRRFAMKPLMNIRFDVFSDRLGELFIAVPRMIFLMVFVQYADRSILSLAVVIGITGWVDLARLIRAETIRLREQSFIEAATVAGIGMKRMFLRHVLPNIWPSVMVVSMYSFSSNIMIESSLSFFGLGLPPDQPSIGTILSEARSYYEYWWMFLLPGIWLSVIIYALFTLPGRLNKLKSTS